MGNGGRNQNRGSRLGTVEVMVRFAGLILRWIVVVTGAGDVGLLELDLWVMEGLCVCVYGC